MGLNQFRKKKVISVEDLVEIADFKQSTMYHIEDNYRNNKLFKYLFLLRKKGVNLNKFFDEEILDKNKNEALKSFNPEEKEELETLARLTKKYKGKGF